MGCAASTAAPSSMPPHPTSSRAAGSSKQGPLDQQASSASNRESSSSLSAADPSPFLEYYTLAALCNRELFGPFLKLCNYDPDTGRLQLSLLLITTKAVQQECEEQLRIFWWNVSGTQTAGSAPQPQPQSPCSRGAAECKTEATAVEGIKPVCEACDGIYSLNDGSGAGGGGLTNGFETAGGESMGDGSRATGTDVDGSGAGGGEGTGGCSSWGDVAKGKAANGGGGDGGGGRSSCQDGIGERQRQQEQQQQHVGAAVPLGAETAAGELLYSWRNWHFWRFRFGTVCGETPKRLVYQVSLLPECSYSIAVPALEEPWRMAFYSCNGVDASHILPCEREVAAESALSLWQDLARRHEQQPFHLLLGGGDQLYNDGVFEGPLLKGWDRTQDDRDTAAKAAIPFTDEVAWEVEEFYFSHYAAYWSQTAFKKLFATIPSFNSWDDHDIVDGWGSYPGIINDSATMQGVFRAAQLFYLLFQHHTTLDRLPGDGYWCGPTSCALLHLGSSVALLVPDTRTCRSQDRILPPSFLHQAQARLAALPPTVQHVMVLLGGPVVYPKLPIQDALQKLNDLFTGDTLISVIMQKTGLAAKVTKRFGMVAYLDDIIDQWSAKQHHQERDHLLQTIIDLSAERGFRFTLLSGDVHCAGYGMIHGRGDESQGDVEDMSVPSERQRAADPRFIPQIVSSAIVNVPPPAALLKLLCLTARKPECILKDCVHRMVPLFGPTDDIDSFLCGRRNWCEATLGGPDGNLSFSWRCEVSRGAAEVEVFSVKVPPLSGGSGSEDDCKNSSGQ
ncbi:hypothetical protein VaNZ11_002671 [Volvox africanus]|uniref:PhoD-like phosphatase domain-containing protein n=1 Tax=Volvox africanus TaxID=51714 RepID=A0ABQ5RTE3_9CHLO|nr:hypothetical protein VaNZ11_002671 [Volvox africanus]